MVNETNRRNVLKSLGVLGIVTGGVVTTSRVVDAEYVGGGSYPLSLQESTTASKVESAITWEQTVGIDVSYYGSFEGNPNRSDPGVFHDFTISGHAGARKHKGEWKDDPYIGYQKVTFEEHNGGSLYPASTTGPHLGVAPDPGGAESADYGDAVKTAMIDILAELNPYYSYAITAADIVNALRRPNSEINGSSVSMKWSYDSGLLQEGYANTSNFVRVLVGDQDYNGGLKATEETNGTTASQSAVSTSLNVTVNDGGLVIASDATSKIQAMKKACF